MKFKIKHRATGAIIFEKDCDSMKLCVTAAHKSDTNLCNADLRGVNLRGADLCGADMSGADLSGADMSGADLCGADLCGANLYSASLYDANLYSASLYDANLSGAYLSGANLSDANLYGADMSYADLRGVNLYGADLSGTYLRGADLYDGHIIDVGQDRRGYRFVANVYKNVITVWAGCRGPFTIAEARKHWESRHADDAALKAECLAKVDLIEAVAKARGWNTGENA